MTFLNKSTTCVFVLLTLLAFSLKGQNSLERVFDIPVFVQNDSLQFPWTGGLVNPQFYALDFDFDGDDDLISFDYQGNFLLVFENTTLAGQEHSYIFRPTLDALFPEVSNWIHLRDFNCDGIKDLLCYNPVNDNVLQYTGAQNTNGFITFNLHQSVIRSFDGQNTAPIPIGVFDRPAFEDIDGDGDLDLLIFNFSDQIDFHSNRSLEWYGHCDSLSFEFITDCWGQFDEEQSEFDFALDVVCDSVGLSSTVQRHVGTSRILPIDYGNDGVWDIIAGWGHGRKLGSLTNDGTINEAHMGAVDNEFPENNKEILLPNFPAAYLLDVNSDTQKELIITPSFKGMAEDNIWLYKNTGTTSFLIWVKEQNSFLQDKMIDAGANSKPTFIDYDHDGLQDLVIANRGIATGDNANVYISYLSLYKNIGTLSNPIFERIEEDWMNLSSLQLGEVKATFGDLDGDGDADLIIGDHFGKLFFIENIAAAGMEITLDMANAVDLDFDIGSLACPELVDVDEDGLLDLLVGEVQGRVFYYRNEGTTANFSFELVTNFFGSIDVRQFGNPIGNSCPCLYQANPDEERILLVGNKHGNVFGFSGMDDQLSAFESVIPELSIIETGENAAPAILYSDDMEQHYLMAGTVRGGLQLYQFKEETSDLDDLFAQEQIETKRITVFPNPISNQKAQLEFTKVNNSQSGILYGYDQIGRKVFEYPLALKANQTRYEIDFSHYEIPPSLLFLQWLGEKKADFQVGKVLLHP